MIIGVDIRCLAERFRTGVGEYAYHLLRRLPAALPKQQFRYFFGPARPHGLSEITAANVDVHHSRLPSKLLNASVRLMHWPRVDARLQADAIFLPSLQSVALRPATPLVVTMHDLSFERYPEFFSPKSRLWHRVINPRRLCQRADAILATSAHTKTEVVAYYGIPSERVTVTPLGVDEKFFARADAARRKEVRKRYRLPERYILTVGNLEPRKNIGSLISAYERLQSEADLVIAGRPVWGVQHLCAAARRSRVANRIHWLGFVSSDDRPVLYQLATCLVYPSYYEGFGLPVLEAMAAGTPVVTSAVTSLPEVAGDAAILVDPYDVADLAEALQAMLDDDTLLERCRQAGKIRAQKFQWNYTVALTKNVFEHIV